MLHLLVSHSSFHLSCLAQARPCSTSSGSRVRGTCCMTPTTPCPEHASPPERPSNDSRPVGTYIYIDELDNIQTSNSSLPPPLCPPTAAPPGPTPTDSRFFSLRVFVCLSIYVCRGVGACALVGAGGSDRRRLRHPLPPWYVATLVSISVTQNTRISISSNTETPIQIPPSSPTHPVSLFFSKEDIYGKVATRPDVSVASVVHIYTYVHVYNIHLSSVCGAGIPMIMAGEEVGAAQKLYLETVRTRAHFHG